MNQPNNFVVDENIFSEYTQKKKMFMMKRYARCMLGFSYTVIIFGVYYWDIISDVLIIKKYFNDRDFWWFGITLGIVVISSLFNTVVLIYYSYLQEFKVKLKELKQYPGIITKSFCLFFQLEMLFW
jgi:hypothetical protein